MADRDKESTDAVWGDFVPSVEDQLIERARLGEITPKQAEAEAARLGLKPFARTPPKSAFDPMKETFWTLSMAVAWIAFRNVDAVRDAWNCYRAECWDWHTRRWRVAPDGPVHDGAFLEKRLPVTLARLRLLGAVHARSEPGHPHSMSVPEARDSLWFALREGLFQATGVRDGGERHHIDPVEWQDLDDFEERGVEVIARRSSGLPASPRYVDVTVPWKPVLKYWREELPAVPSLPPTISPATSGYMPLYCAAQWIATKGGTLDFDPLDLERWKPAYASLLSHLASGEVSATGMKNGMREQIPGYTFASCPVDYPFSDASLELITSRAMQLRSYAFFGDEQWRRGFDDALIVDRKTIWNQILVLCRDVRAIWPFSADKPARSGAPGRPTSMQLVEVEFARRAAANEQLGYLSEEARYLERWLKTTAPGHPRATAKTIENRIREPFRAAKAGRVPPGGVAGR